MSLKSLIQRLLDSRTTPEEAGHSAMPSTTATVTYTPLNSISDFGIVLNSTVATHDGYIRVSGKSTANNGFLQVNAGGLEATTGATITGGEALQIYAPIAKGQTFSVWGRSLNPIGVSLFKAIGGGV